MNAAETHAPASGGPPPVGYIGRRALRFWKEAALVFVIVVAATLVFARATWQPYKSEAVLMYAETVTRDMVPFDAGQAGARLKEMLHASTRIRTVITKYNLFPELSTAQAIEEVKKRLDFQVQPGGTFSLSYVGFSPQEAQNVLRDLTDGLLADHNVERSKRLQGTREMMQSERVRLEEEVRQREAAVKTFVGQHPEVASLNDDSTIVVDPRIVALEQELRSAMASASSGGSAASAEASRSITDLIDAKRAAEADLARAKRDLEDKLSTFTEAHPDVIAARDRVSRLQSDVARARQQMERAPSTGGSKGNDDNVRSIRAQLDALRSASRRPKDPKTLQLGVQYDDLKHNLAEARQRLTRIQDQEVQMSVAEKMEKSGNLLNLTVHDPASLPGSPMQSRRRRTAMGGLFVAILLAAGTALARALTSDKLFDRHDIANMTGAPVLAIVPALPKRARGR
jgi:polysaccharide biosynthesis transport protein